MLYVHLSIQYDYNAFCSVSEASSNAVQTMCNLTDQMEEGCGTKGLKRKSTPCYLDEIFIPKKRLSPLLNTPKEKKELKKKILKLSIQKLKQTENAEVFLRRSVLINNTMKRMQSELRREKKRHNYLSNFNVETERLPREPDTLNNNCLLDAFMLDDPFLSGAHEQITDDMTDTLVVNLENTLGISITSISSVNEELNLTKLLPVSKDGLVDSGAEVGTYVDNAVSSKSCCSRRFGSGTCGLMESSNTNSISGSFQLCVTSNLDNSNQKETFESPSLYRIQKCLNETTLLTC